MYVRVSTSTGDVKDAKNFFSRLKDEAFKHQVFFVKDLVELGDLSVEWCPTASMVADFLTKPLQVVSRPLYCQEVHFNRVVSRDRH